jgi:hypothetical protein
MIMQMIYRGLHLARLRWRDDLKQRSRIRKAMVLDTACHAAVQKKKNGNYAGCPRQEAEICRIPPGSKLMQDIYPSLKLTLPRFLNAPTRLAFTSACVFEVVISNTPAAYASLSPAARETQL